MDVSGHRSNQFTTIIAETRRVRTEQERRAIVAEAMLGYRNASAMARKYGICPEPVVPLEAVVRVARKTIRPTFVSVIRARQDRVAAACLFRAATRPIATIEIETAGGRKLRVGVDIDIGALKRILVALETV